MIEENTKELILELINESRKLHQLLEDEKVSLTSNKPEKLHQISTKKEKLAKVIGDKFNSIKEKISNSEYSELKTTLSEITNKNIELSNINNSIINQLINHNKQLIRVLTNSKPETSDYSMNGKFESSAPSVDIAKA
jgi:flagellar biosynthesis/type III secretory pathway chaperone